MSLYSPVVVTHKENSLLATKVGDEGQCHSADSPKEVRHRTSYHSGGGGGDGDRKRRRGKRSRLTRLDIPQIKLDLPNFKSPPNQIPTPVLTLCYQKKNINKIKKNNNKNKKRKKKNKKKNKKKKNKIRIQPERCRNIEKRNIQTSVLTVTSRRAKTKMEKKNMKNMKKILTGKMLEQFRRSK